MSKRHIQHYEVYNAAYVVYTRLLALFADRKVVKCYPVPRGGIPASYMLLDVFSTERESELRMELVNTPEEADFILDDLVDSGGTMDHYTHEYPDTPFLSLFVKTNKEGWYIFPWEGNEQGSAEDIPTRLLQFVGEDSNRGGLSETPKRFLKAWQHFTSGYEVDPKDVLKVFEDGAEKCDEMVLVKNIPLYSQCEHHLVPFFGTAHIAYIPDGKIVGLSKLSRIVDIFARRLQVQERLTNQIADALNENLAPKGVAVVLECRHLCMEARGVSQQGHTTVTSAMRGVFMEHASTRAEFMGLIK